MGKFDDLLNDIQPTKQAVTQPPVQEKATSTSPINPSVDKFADLTADIKQNKFDDLLADIKPSFMGSLKEAFTNVLELPEVQKYRRLPQIPTSLSKAKEFLVNEVGRPESPFEAAAYSALPEGLAGKMIVDKISELQTTLEKAGEEVAETLGKKGYPKTGVTLGTALSFAPDIAMLGAGLGSVARSALKRVAAKKLLQAQLKAFEKEGAKELASAVPKEPLLLPAPKIVEGPTQAGKLGQEAALPGFIMKEPTQAMKGEYGFKIQVKPSLITKEGEQRIETAKEIVNTGKITDLPKSPLSGLRQARLEPIRVFEETKGPIGEVLKEEQRIASDAIDTARRKSVDTIREVQSLGFKAGSKESAVMQDLEEGKISLQEVINTYGQETTARMQNALSIIRKNYDNLLNEVNKTRVMKGLEPLIRRKDYFNHFQELSLLEETMDLFTQKSARSLMEKGKQLVTDMQLKRNLFAKMKDVIFAHTERPEGVPYTSDAIGGFERYVKSANRYIHLQPWVDEIKGIINVIKQKAPNLAAYVDDWSSYVAGQAQPIDVLLKKYAGSQIIDAAGRLSGNFISGVVEGNPAVVLSQLYGLAPSAAENGIIKTAAALASKVANPEMRKFAIAHSRIVRERLLDAEEALLRRGKIRHSLSVPMYKVDTEVVLTNWIAAFERNLSKGIKTAIKLADEQVAKTQGWTSIVNKPTLLRSRTFQQIFPLQNQATAFVNYVWEDLVKQGIAQHDLKTALKVLSFMATYAAAATTRYAGVGKSGVDLGDLFPLLRLAERPGGVFASLANAYQQLARGNIEAGSKKLAETLFIASRFPASLQVLKMSKKLLKEPKNGKD